METSRRDNAMLMIQFAGYYQALLKLLKISRTMTTIAWKIINHHVSREWGEKRIRSLARDGFDVFHVKLFANEVYLQSHEECEYPGSAKFIFWVSVRAI